MMGRLVIRDGKRQLLFSPTDTAFGKNPGQLDPIVIPHITAADYAGLLGRVIQETKDSLNRLTEDQRLAVEEQDWFRENLPHVDSAELVNDLLERARTGGEICKKLLNDRAKTLGFNFDKDAKAFVAPIKEAAE